MRIQLKPLFCLLLATVYAAATAGAANNEEASSASPSPLPPNEVTFVNFLTQANARQHKTSRYETGGAFLVLRRGELFEFIVSLARPYDETLDKLRLEFYFDSRALKPAPVHVPLVTTARRANLSQPVELSQTNWDARIVSTPPPPSGPKAPRELREIRVQVHLPTSMAIGAWRLQISTKVARADAFRTFKIRDLFYVIFNPFNQQDDAHLAQEELRDEYLMNESGTIFIGTHAFPRARRWTYGQFDGSVLPTVMLLLDRTALNYAERADVVKTSRAVSAIVNANDEGGLLVGNWSENGRYDDGVSPELWSGSSTIFRRFVSNGFRSVKFAQCWVFGGTTTATLRSLGIAARTISNFNSAHDTDSSLTVDKFHDGFSEMRGVNGDSIWNFHVWSEAWMRRRDLPDGFGGWQAIDATPQERSNGAYQLGPASVEAVRQGKTGWAYDVGFVFSEVNADIVYWRPDGRRRFKWQKVRIQSAYTGSKVLTRGRFNSVEDITSNYKFPEGSPEARRTHAEAIKAFGVEALFSERR